MAAVLTDWINRKIVLSQHIEVLERDFADGYLMGELLSKLGYLPDYKGLLVRSENPQDMIRNYEKMLSIFENMEIPVSRKQVRNIVLEARGEVVSTFICENKFDYYNYIISYMYE
jgi:hypothetical protein